MIRLEYQILLVLRQLLPQLVIRDECLKDLVVSYHASFLNLNPGVSMAFQHLLEVLAPYCEELRLIFYAPKREGEASIEDVVNISEELPRPNHREGDVIHCEVSLDFRTSIRYSRFRF